MYKQVKVMGSHIRYSPLPSEEQNPLPVKTGKFSFPKITRLKCAGIVFVVVVTAGLVAMSCLQSGYFSKSVVCNTTKDKTLFDEQESKSSDRVKLHHIKRRLPQCIIIGARKAGTRALLTYLNIHPDIVVVGPEMHFFDDDESYQQSLEWYRKQMPFTYPDQLTIEKTPAYFTEEEVPERVYRMNKTIKLLLILRDPVERTISDYVQLAEGKKARNKPIEKFESHVIDSHGNINRSYKAVKRSIYHKHLTRWLEFFPLGQIFIIESEDLVSDPASVMFDVENYLEVSHKIKPGNFYFNKTKGFYCIQTHEQQKCLTESKGRPHPDVDPEVIHKLRKYFAPHNRKLFKLIGHEFNWPES